MISEELKDGISKEIRRLIANGFGERVIEYLEAYPTCYDTVKFPIIINGVLDHLIYSVKEKRFTHVEIQYSPTNGDEDDMEIVKIKL